MTLALWLCSLPLIAEFAVAPFNLWSGRTIGNFTRFTGLPPVVATRLFAPLKLLAALLLASGLAVGVLGAVGAAIVALISIAYLTALAPARRRQRDGTAAFGLTLAIATAVFVLQASR